MGPAACHAYAGQVYDDRPPAATGRGTTALGRLQLRLPRAGERGEVVKERRHADLAAARAWCERTVTALPAGAEVLEIQVFEEVWWHARSWDDADHRPVPEVLQLGMLDGSGLVRWSEPRSMTPRAADRIAL